MFKTLYFLLSIQERASFFLSLVDKHSYLDIQRQSAKYSFQELLHITKQYLGVRVSLMIKFLLKIYMFPI